MSLQANHSCSCYEETHWPTLQVDFMLGSGDVEVDDGDYHQRTALHLASSNGHIAMVRHLVLQHGAYLNVVDRYGGTPMMDAVRQRHAEVVAFLKRTGAVFDPDVSKGLSLIELCTCWMIWA